MNKEIYGLSWRKFNDNLYPFFSANGLVIFLWCVTAVLDAHSTTKFMAVIGPETELHPITKSLSCNFGIYAGPYLSGALKLLIALPLLVCWKNFARYILMFGSVFQLLAFKSNMRTYEYFSNIIPEELWWQNISRIVM